MPEAGDIKQLAAGTKVAVVTPGDVPEWSGWDDDRGRSSAQVKRRLQEMFFRGDKRVTGEIVYVPSESERDELKRKGRAKVRVKEASGTMIVITADATNLRKR